MIDNLPKIKEQLSPYGQAKKVKSEVQELVSDLLWQRDALALVEFWDVVQAVKTLYERLEEVHGAEAMATAREVMIQKNTDRGYYT